MSKKLFKGITIIGTIVGIIVGVFQIMEFFKVQNKETTTIIDNTSLQKIPEGFKETKSELKNKLQSNDIKLEDNGVINQGVIGNINNNRNLNYTNIQNKITDNNENKRELYRKKENIIKELEMFRENYFEWDNRKVENTNEKLKQDINLNFKRKQELNNLEKEMFDINYNYGNFLNLTKKEQIDKINKNTWNSLTEAMKLEAEETLKK